MYVYSSKYGRGLRPSSEQSVGCGNRQKGQVIVPTNQPRRAELRETTPTRNRTGHHEDYLESRSLHTS